MKKINDIFRCVGLIYPDSRIIKRLLIEDDDRYYFQYCVDDEDDLQGHDIPRRSPLAKTRVKEWKRLFESQLGHPHCSQRGVVELNLRALDFARKTGRLKDPVQVPDRDAYFLWDNFEIPNR